MIRSNTSEVIKVILSKMSGIQADQVSRECAVAVLPEMRHRIHVDGKDSSGNQIGTYSNAYMKVRTGRYSRNETFSKGKNKGQTKPGGIYTKGQHKGEPRKQYNRTSDTKVVLSLTRQMENDMNVLAAGRNYGIGYNNPLNFKKSVWCEETYQKPVFQLTSGEIELVKKVAQDFIDKLS